MGLGMLDPSRASLVKNGFLAGLAKLSNLGVLFLMLSLVLALVAVGIAPFVVKDISNNDRFTNIPASVTFVVVVSTLGGYLYVSLLTLNLSEIDCTHVPWCC